MSGVRAGEHERRELSKYEHLETRVPDLGHNGRGVDVYELLWGLIAAGILDELQHWRFLFVYGLVFFIISGSWIFLFFSSNKHPHMKSDLKAGWIQRRMLLMAT